MAKSTAGYTLSQTDRRQLGAMLKWFKHNHQVVNRNTVRRRPRTPSGAASTLRIGKCTENPKARNYIICNLYSADTGLEQTTGEESGIYAYGLIASGTRLDRCVPRLADDMLVYVTQINWLNASEEVEARWFLIPPYQASRDYTG